VKISLNFYMRFFPVSASITPYIVFYIVRVAKFDISKISVHEISV
jgi:hypothetical protein